MSKQDAEIWSGTRAPDGSPIFEDQTCYALVCEDDIKFWIFDDDDISGLDLENYDWSNERVHIKL